MIWNLLQKRRSNIARKRIIQKLLNEIVHFESKYDESTRKKEILELLNKYPVFSYRWRKDKHYHQFTLFLKTPFGRIVRIDADRSYDSKYIRLNYNENYRKADYREVYGHGTILKVNFNFKKDYCLLKLQNIYSQ